MTPDLTELRQRLTFLEQAFAQDCRGPDWPGVRDELKDMRAQQVVQVRNEVRLAERAERKAGEAGR